MGPNEGHRRDRPGVAYRKPSAGKKGASEHRVSSRRPRTEAGLGVGAGAARKAEEGGLRRYVERTGVCLREPGSRAKLAGASLGPGKGRSPARREAGRDTFSVVAGLPPLVPCCTETAREAPVQSGGAARLSLSHTRTHSAFLWVPGDEPVEWGWRSQTVLGRLHISVEAHLYL